MCNNECSLQDHQEDGAADHHIQDLATLVPREVLLLGQGHPGLPMEDTLAMAHLRDQPVPDLPTDQIR